MVQGKSECGKDCSPDNARLSQWRFQCSLNIFSSLLLPLIFGVITIALAVHQQTTMTKQHTETLLLAREQRLEDQHSSQEQRRDDLRRAREQRDLDHWVERERYRNDLLLDYAKEIRSIMKENNSTTTSDSFNSVFLRLQTMNTFEQLDSPRITNLIRSLYEIGNLRNLAHHPPLDLSNIKLRDMDFSTSIADEEIIDVSFAGVHLINSSFVNLKIKNANFSHSQFSHVRFSDASISNSTFYNSQINQADFSRATLDRADFSRSSINSVVYFGSRFSKTNFTYATLNHINFTNTILLNTIFNRAFLAAVNFSYATFKHRTNFSQAWISSSSFSHALLKGAMFRDASLTSVSFKGANLRRADLTNAKISSTQLSDALSVRDARLPNGTIAREPNLLKNGYATCHVSSLDDWRIHQGMIFVQSLEEDSQNCAFTLQTGLNKANMSQQIDLRWI